jgi:hypothetical protein
MPEPRDPLLKVLTIYIVLRRHKIQSLGPLADAYQPEPVARRESLTACQSNKSIVLKGGRSTPKGHELCNDPSAGSPTETLLRLLLPLNDRV